MTTLSKLATATLMTAVGAQTLAAAATRDSVEKTALTAHPGKVEMVEQTKRMGKDVWEVKIKGNDGREYNLYYDISSGNEIK